MSHRRLRKEKTWVAAASPPRFPGPGYSEDAAPTIRSTGGTPVQQKQRGREGGFPAGLVTNVFAYGTMTNAGSLHAPVLLLPLAHARFIVVFLAWLVTTTFLLWRYAATAENAETSKASRRDPGN